jgi:hypothetical protein
MSSLRARAGRPPSRPNLPPPITDADAHHAVELLKRYESGLTRADLVKFFGGDRRARDIMAAVVERSIAAVIVTESPYHGNALVYRLARSLEEVEREERRLRAYELSARRRREGLRPAFERGPATPQATLF